MLTFRLRRPHQGLYQLWRHVSRLYESSTGRCRIFHSLITGIFVVDPAMFYVSDLYPNPRPRTIGCLDVYALDLKRWDDSDQRDGELRENLEGRKNQQSRVEHPITDWFASWSCCKGFHPRNRRHKELTRGRVAAKRCGSRWRDRGGCAI